MDGEALLRSGVEARCGAKTVCDPESVTGCAVDMGMKLQALVPGVEHAEEADLSCEVSRIASDLQQGRSAGMEQQVIDDALVLQGEWGQFVGQRENDMHIAGRQQFAFAGFEPAHPGVALASWAMPVAARVEGDGGVSAAGAHIAMSAQRSGTATVMASKTF